MPFENATGSAFAGSDVFDYVSLAILPFRRAYSVNALGFFTSFVFESFRLDALRVSSKSEDFETTISTVELRRTALFLLVRIVFRLLILLPFHFSFFFCFFTDLSPLFSFFYFFHFNFFFIHLFSFFLFRSLFLPLCFLRSIGYKFLEHEVVTEREANLSVYFFFFFRITLSFSFLFFTIINRYKFNNLLTLVLLRKGIKGKQNRNCSILSI